MPLYVIEAPHSEAQHDRALRETLAMAPASQKAFVWGCPGEHKAWAFVDAAGRGDALDIVPRFLRNAASAHRVKMFSADDVAGVWEDVA
jgi:hypothetical protein